MSDLEYYLLRLIHDAAWEALNRGSLLMYQRLDGVIEMDGGYVEQDRPTVIECIWDVSHTLTLRP